MSLIFNQPTLGNSSTTTSSFYNQSASASYSYTRLGDDSAVLRLATMELELDFGKIEFRDLVSLMEKLPSFTIKGYCSVVFIPYFPYNVNSWVGQTTNGNYVYSSQPSTGSIIAYDPIPYCTEEP